MTGKNRPFLLNFDRYSTALQLAISETFNDLEAVLGSRLLLNETEHEIYIGWYYGSKEGFSALQQSLDPLYYQRPLEERVRIAIDIAIHGNEPEVVRLSLALGPLPSLTHSMTGRWGRTLVNAVAKAMGIWMSRSN